MTGSQPSTPTLNVTRYLGGVLSPPQVDRMLTARILDYYTAHPGLGIWMTVERASGTRVGFHLLNNIQGESSSRSDSRCWNRLGPRLGTEMAAAVLRYGFVDLGLPTIAGMASLRIWPPSGCWQRSDSNARGARLCASRLRRRGPMAWFERERAAWLAVLTVIRSCSTVSRG